MLLILDDVALRQHTKERIIMDKERINNTLTELNSIKIISKIHVSFPVRGFPPN